MGDPQEVVIRDNNGTEHVFPAGFDPHKAAAIVSRATDERPPFDAEAEGMMDLGKHPGLNAAGPAIAFAPFAPLAAMVRGAGSAIVRATESPIVGGALGAYHGYQKNGLIGALEGGAAGALGSGFIRGANKLVPAATRYLEAGAAAKAAPQMAKPLEMLPRVEEMATAGRASGLPERQIGSMVDQLKRDFLLRTLGNSRY